jgi:hypothetical protein
MTRMTVINMHALMAMRRLFLKASLFPATAFLALFLTSCATPSGPFVTDTVGPNPRFSGTHREGTLQVFTATSSINDGDIMYYPHTSYRIYQPDRTFVKFVRNHADRTDQRPAAVVLPAGRYYIVARSEGHGVVKVPVLIKGYQVTCVYLDNTVMKEASGSKSDQLVCFPNGWVIGWRAKEDQ